MTSARMPAAFLGHGSPMNAIESNRYTEAWRSLSVPRPRAILVVSAHWYVNVTAVTAMPKPRTIHDFYGFPKALFDVEYPAPGDTAVAEEIAEIVKPTHVGLDHDSWGIDHGSWSLLVHAFPAADVPVLQLSIDARKDFDFHFELGTRLAPLRERGVLVIGSGNVVHDLGSIDWKRRDAGFDWAHRFDEHARRVVTEDPSATPSLSSHPDFAHSAPTPEHFIPLLHFAGLAAAAGRKPEVLVDGYAYGSLSMTCFTLDHAIGATAGRGHAGSLPDPLDTPADDTNL